MAAALKAREHARSTPISSSAVYERISALTGIPFSRLKPLVSTNNEKTKDGTIGEYADETHSVEVWVKKCNRRAPETAWTLLTAQDVIEHEELHGVPYLLSGGRSSLLAGDASEMFADAAGTSTLAERFRPTKMAFLTGAIFSSLMGFSYAKQFTELTQRALSYFVSFPGKCTSIAACTPAQITADFSRFMFHLGGSAFLLFGGVMVSGAVISSAYNFFSRTCRSLALDKYGVDGYIALCATRLRTFTAKRFLHGLEKKGILTREGFTEKGEQWIASLKPKIEEFLENAEKERKSTGMS